MAVVEKGRTGLFCVGKFWQPTDRIGKRNKLVPFAFSCTILPNNLGCKRLSVVDDRIEVLLIPTLDAISNTFQKILLFSALLYSSSFQSSF